MELATTGLDNDTRGWIMTIASGLGKFRIFYPR